MSAVRRAAGSAVAVLVGLSALTACSDEPTSNGTDPVEVKLGEPFEWNGFAIDKGWTMRAIKRSAGVDQVTSPEVKGTLTNDSDTEQAAIFQLVFSRDSAPIATLNCSAKKIKPGEVAEFVCPGLGATMPEDYDAIVVQKFTRESSNSTSG